MLHFEFLGESGRHGTFEALPCLYRFLCRAVALFDGGRPFPVMYDDVNRTVDITFLGNIRGSLAIVSLFLDTARLACCFPCLILQL